VVTVSDSEIASVSRRSKFDRRKGKPREAESVPRPNACARGLGPAQKLLNEAENVLTDQARYCAVPPQAA